MLRVGLTGELGSGKSTVARMMAEQGAVVLSSDEMGRAMMQPGEPVYREIVQHFGPGILLGDGQLNRPELARLAFDLKTPRVEELNALIHPAVIAEQERQIRDLARAQPHALVVIESALLFTTRHAGSDEPWRKRFDKIVVVTASDELKIARFLRRAPDFASLSAEQQQLRQRDAEARLAAQRLPSPLPDDVLVIFNTGDLAALQKQVDQVLEQVYRDTQNRRDMPGDCRASG